MLLVLIVGGALGWFIHRAAIRRDAVKAIEEAGGSVKYDFQRTTSLATPSQPPWPKWLVNLVGIDFLAEVTSVSFRTSRRNAASYTQRWNEAILVEMGRLPRLEVLDAASVSVTDAGMAHLAGLTRLRGLEIRGTPGLTDAGLAHLAGLGLPRSLSIQGTMGIGVPGLAHLSGLEQLGSLRLDTRTHDGPESLSKLTHLKMLSLGMANVNDEAFAKLSRLTCIDDLAFGGKAGDSSGMVHPKAMTALGMIQLYGPWISDEGLAPMAKMGHLKTFFVADTASVTPGGLYRLQQQRPGLRLGINGTGKVPRPHAGLLRRSIGPGAVPPMPQ